jgi:hypothetical protein
MKRLFTAITAGCALMTAAACTQNAARDVDQPVSASRDSVGSRDTTTPAYKAMQRSDSATMERTDTMSRRDTMATRQDTLGRAVTPRPTVRDTAGTQPARTSPR